MLGQSANQQRDQAIRNTIPTVIAKTLNISVSGVRCFDWSCRLAGGSNSLRKELLHE